MLLRIIDLPAAHPGENNSVRVVFQNNNNTETFVIASYASPITDNFRKTLASYFADYRHGVISGDKDPAIVEKLITFGQYLGDELLGEDHQMIAMKKKIEAQGFAYLRVQIESGRLEFFNEFWEIAILFEAKYMLSAVVEGFARVFTDPAGPADLPELCYNLHAVVPGPDLGQLFADGKHLPEVPPSTDSHRPLRMLVWVSRPETMALPFASSNAINMALDAASAGGVIDIHTRFNGSWSELHKHLNDPATPVHIFHYDGPVIIDKEQVFFTSKHSEDELIPLDALVQQLVTHKVGALCVDARIYLQDQQPLAAGEGLARIARVAQQRGLGNVIGLAYVTNPWFSQLCFQSIYTWIARGLSLGQAVVEARKALQKNAETTLMSTKPTPVPCWSLLVHYGVQPVIFFARAQVLAEGNHQPAGLPAIHDKLFGFHTDLLPPLFRCASDGQALVALEALRQPGRESRAGSLAIQGESGSGKTQLAHLVCSHLALQDSIDYAFYFNFSAYNYTRENMLEMIAPLVKARPDDYTEITAHINRHRCCFVLDQLVAADTSRAPDYWAESGRFIENLLAAGHSVLFVSEKESPLQHLAARTILLPPLPPVERAILAAKKLHAIPLQDIAQDHHFETLLEASRGNPWLVNKAIPLLSRVSTRELSTGVEQLFQPQPEAPLKQAFFAWQWASLAPDSQALLTLISGPRGLLLEMLAAVADRPEASAPVKTLFDRLGCKQGQLSNYIEDWHMRGFVQRNPLGRLLDPEAYGFLATKPQVAPADNSELSFLFHQWLCEAIGLLTQHLLKTPNTSLSNYLLHQRRQWVIAFEDLWFKQDYRGFIRVKQAFDELLQQAKLTAESSAWSLDLLKRSPAALPCAQTSGEPMAPDGQLAWLAVAIEALREPEAKDLECILLAAGQWRAWVEGLSDSLDQTQLALFQRATVFLEIFYQARAEWQDCLAIARKAHLIYSEYQAWHKVIQSLKSLATYSAKLGDSAQILIFENKIIQDIPYAEAPPGFKLQHLLDILFARIHRADLFAAQSLLDELRQDQSAEKLSEVLDGAQCDIDFQQGNYLAALPHYARLWSRALAAQQDAQLVQLKSRLVDIERQLGSEAFAACFDDETPEGTVRPMDFISGLH